MNLFFYGTTSLNNYVKEVLHIDESTKTDYPALLLYGTFQPLLACCVSAAVQVFVLLR